MKKRYILRSVLIAVGVVAVLISVFVAEQYYRWHICNFRAKDGEQHSYNIYAGASIDSVLNLIREDYEISSETDLMLHMRFLVFNAPEPGHYRFPAQIGDRELIERLKFDAPSDGQRDATPMSGRRSVSRAVRLEQRDEPLSVYPEYVRGVLEYHAQGAIQPDGERV